jgi:hypothetical protein
VAHFKERSEKNCLNCNAEVAGRYCQVCGQENIVTQESFGHLLRHFFEDITHFDGKFFASTKKLLLKPGFLPMEYVSGRRASYLHPIRMYVFASALLFLVFFWVTGGKKKITEIEKSKEHKQKLITSIDTLLVTIKDTNTLKNLKAQKTTYENEIVRLDTTYKLPKEQIKFSNKPFEVNLDDDNQTKVDSIAKIDNGNTTKTYPTIEAYEKAQAALPENKKDGWMTRIMEKKRIDVQNNYSENKREYVDIIKEKFLHSLPQMFFLTLPFFALILKLLYKNNEKFAYADHGIFSIYHFIAVFIILLCSLLLTKLFTTIGWGVIPFVNIALYMYILFYLYKSMRNFYAQNRGKTIIKFLLLCFMSGAITLIFTLTFLFFTFLKV